MHLESRAPREGRPAHWPDWAHPDVVAGLAARGVSAPWAHQVAAASLVWRGTHTVVATGTASGKSLCYLLPALSSIRGSVDGPGERGSTVLYLAPTKALARDQLEQVARLDVPGVRASAYDGDASHEERDWATAHANYVVTNPDMLHRTMLPQHARWAQFWSLLRYVVVDECHHYRGVFGAHTAQILRRLRRVAAHYDAEPTVVLASATVAYPDRSTRRLVGVDTVAVTEDGAPRGSTVLGLWEPPLTGERGEHEAPVRRSAPAECAELLADLVADGVRTLAFVRSRRAAESVCRHTRALLEDVDPALPGRVAPYRGGYLPEDRRELEDRLRRGDLLAVTATNALELGIDIAGLDAVLVVGYPGTRASLWQQVGRAGRAGAGGMGLFIARDDPLDTFLVHHPATLLDAPVEASVFDPGNPYVLAPHLCAAAQELPLSEQDLASFEGEPEQVADSLAATGHLRRRGRRWYWAGRGRAADLADIRSSGGAPVQVVESDTGRLVGTVDTASAHSTVHTGAVYVHLADTYLVRDFDHEAGTALVERVDPGYTTSAREVTDLAVTEVLRTQVWGRATLTFGTVEVSSQVVAFLKRRHGSIVGEQPLDLPARHLPTKAVWWTLPESVDTGIDPRDLPGAVHAAEHAAIGLLPLFATCDRGDIGGLSTVCHPDTEALTVFVYDGHPGGAGFAEHGFAVAEQWLRATHDAVVACECPAGCPSCVQSPKCGNGNEPLHKAGAISLLRAVLAGARSPATDYGGRSDSTVSRRALP